MKLQEKDREVNQLSNLLDTEKVNTAVSICDAFYCKYGCQTVELSQTGIQNKALSY